MKGRVNKRVDKCIHLLLKIARDKGFECLIKLEKGKVSHRISCIRQRHKSSADLSTHLIQDNGNDLWRVTSSKNPLLYYEVRKEDARCSSNCPLRCTECDICIHQYSCTCPDSLVRLTICKRIHLLIRKLYDDNMHNVHNTTHIITNDAQLKQNETTKILQEMTSLSQQTTSPASHLQKNITTLQSLVSHCSDANILKIVNNFVCRAINVIHMKSPTTMYYTNHYNTPVTTKIIPQSPFHSQRKRSRKSTVKLAKPTAIKKMLIQQSLFVNSAMTSEEKCKQGEHVI